MSKNLTEVLADLRLDLKDTAALWSTAELTRSVERAVADLSRFLPLERSYEVVADAEVEDETFTTLVAADTDLFVATMALTLTVDGNTCTLTGSQPDAPRQVVVTLTDGDATITALRIIIKGNDTDDNYIEESLYLSEAVSLVLTGKRYFKRILEVEVDDIAGNIAGDFLIVGTGSPTGVWIELANKPIKLNSDTITDCTKDTDYIMDYSGGRIALKSSGAMTADTAYDITYTKSQVHVDISNLKDFIRLDRVEYPSGNVPQIRAVAELWGGILTITGSGQGSQAAVADAEHITIHYLAQHKLPAESAPGSYPDFLDATVALAAAAYALFTKALQYEHQAVTDLATNRTTLENIAAIHALVGTALGKVTTYMTDADGALDLAAAQVVLAATALVKVTTYLETNTDFNAVDLLEDITAALHAAVVTAAGHADSVLTQLASAVGITEGDLSDVYIEQKKFMIAAAGYSDIEAETFLEAGDGFINKVNLGSRVPENYREYAEVSARLADVAGQVGYNLSNLAHAESNSFSAIAQSMSAVAQSLQAAANAAAVLVSNNRSYVEESTAWVAIANGFIGEAAQRTNAALAYINEAAGRFSMCQAFIGEAQARLAEIDGYLAEAEKYQSTASWCIALAEKFRLDAVERRNEAWAIWKDAPQFAPMYAMTSVRQLTSG